MNPVLNYACGGFVPPDQFKVAEAHSQIFFIILTCWFKSSGGGNVLYFVIDSFPPAVLRIEMQK